MASNVDVSSSDEKKPNKARLYVGVNLFIKNLHQSITDNRLWEIFSVHGIIISCKVQLDENGISKGFGFVCLATAEQAAAAIAALNGKVICSKPLYVGVFETKEERAKNRLKKAIEHFQPPAENPKSYEEFLQQSLARGRGRGRVSNPIFGAQLNAGMAAAPYMPPLVNALYSPPRSLSATSNSGIAVVTDASATPKPATQAAAIPNDDHQLPYDEAQQFTQTSAASLPRYESTSLEPQPLYGQALTRPAPGETSPRGTPSGDAPVRNATYGQAFLGRVPGVTSPRGTRSGDSPRVESLPRPPSSSTPDHNAHYGQAFPRHFPGVTSPPSAGTPEGHALHGQALSRPVPGVRSPRGTPSSDAPACNAVYGQTFSWPVPGVESQRRPARICSPNPYASESRYASIEYISPLVYQARSHTNQAPNGAGN